MVCVVFVYVLLCGVCGVYGLGVWCGLYGGVYGVCVRLGGGECGGVGISL